MCQVAKMVDPGHVVPERLDNNNNSYNEVINMITAHHQNG
jgi:hypothetical protein